MLKEDGENDPAVMAAACVRCRDRTCPSEVVVPGLLEGLPSVGRLVALAQATEEPALPAVARIG